MATPDPEGTGAAKCMNAALQQSNLSYGAIDYINAHGTGTKLNDRMETKAIKQVFKENSKEIPISSSKSMLGHTRGASGALEGLISILSIVNEFIPLRLITTLLIKSVTLIMYQTLVEQLQFNM